MSGFATNWKIGFSIIRFKKMKWLAKYFVVEAWKGMEFSVRLKNILAGGGRGQFLKRSQQQPPFLSGKSLLAETEMKFL